MKYGFSSKVLGELGGGEKQRVVEFAAGLVLFILFDHRAPRLISRSCSDFEWSEKGRLVRHYISLRCLCCGAGGGGGFWFFR